MTPAVVLALVASLQLAMPVPAQADPVTPPGATTTPPVQQSSSVTAPPLGATDATQGVPGERVEERDPTVHPVPPLGAASMPTQDLTPVETPERPSGYLEGISVEVPSSRTPYSTDYVNVDGTRTMKLFGEVAFVPDPAGGLRPLDTSLSVRPGDARIVPAAAADVSFAPTADAASLARWDVGGGTHVGFGLANATSVGASTAGGVATYVGVRPYADLHLSATGSGMKESIVLHSAAAPTSWLFPLQTGGGLTPRLNAASGSVQFIDRHDIVKATIPPGFMVDSSGSGRPARSNRVVYALEQDGPGWALRVELDAAWLRAPGRVFPVIVDPAVYGENDDTFVSSRDYANRDNSAEGALYVGTKDGGGDISASYLHFNLGSVGNRFIFSGGLTVYAADAASCTPKPVSIHAVTQPWAGGTTTTWAGPGFEETPLDTQTFASGYSASCPAGTQFFNLPGGRLTRWAHGLDPFYGFTLRASSTDSLAWKKFWSDNNVLSLRPNLWLNYVDNGAGYVYPNPMVTPTVTTPGSTMIRITNLGTTTWTTAANNYRFNYAILNSSGSFVQASGLMAVPYAVAPNQTVEFPIAINALPLGTYTLRGDMVTPANESFYLTYAVPMGQVQFTVANGPPVATAVFPEPNSTVDTIRPALWVRDVDPDQTGTTRKYMFKVCAGEFTAPVDCQDSGASWVTTQTWVPPTALKWHRQVFWQVRLSDGAADSAWLGPWYFTPTVAQPSIAAHLAGASGAEMPGVNPQAGNYATSITDAQVNVAGPALHVSRTYNSQDLRTSGAFGTGWSSPIDQKIVLDSVSYPVVTLASGLEVRFGDNGDGTYSPPAGQNLTLVYTASPASWTLRDRSGTRRTFDVVSGGGRLSSVVDTDGRTQTYTYNGSGELTTIANTFVGGSRALHLTWTSGYVTTVATDVPAVGQAAPTWTYTYTGDRLTSACNPLGGCVTYTYTSSSHYRSAVSNDAPTGYWPLGETTGMAARNVMATLPEHRDGIYNNVTQGAAGPLSGTVDTATTYSSTSPSWVTLPADLVNETKFLSVELWFKAASGKSGVLFGEQTVPIVASGYNEHSSSPMLYVGTDGKLRGMAPVAGVESTMVGPASKCVTVSGGNYANLTQIQLQTCNGGAQQRFTRQPDGTVRWFDKCLNISGGGTANGTKVILYACAGQTNEVWEPYNNGLRNPVSGRCLDAPATTDGTQLQIYDCNGTAAQLWSIPTVVAPMVYTTAVTDGNWHHVVLSVGASGQTLWVDGVSRATLTGPVVDHRANAYAYIGALRASTGWPAGPATSSVFGFTGQIDEVAYYQYSLAESQVTDHYAARNTTQRLATVVEPGPFTATTLTYDSNTGRVATEVDRHGATWTLNGPTLTSPALGEGRRHVTFTSTARTAPVTYTYDPRHGDRLVAHVDAYGTRSYTYDDANKGFLASTKDENGVTTTQTTDERGNVKTRTTTRETGVTNTEYFDYFPVGTDLLDPRNDVQIRSADARSANATDPTYETLRTIDAAGRVTHVSYPIPAGQSTRPTEEYVYSDGSGGVPAGLLLSATARNDGETINMYNAAGDLLTTTDPVGLVTTYTYDGLGRVATSALSSDVSGHVDYGTTTKTYNGLSQPLVVVSPGVHNPIANVTHTQVTTHGYDTMGRLTSQAVSDSTGGDTTRTTSYTYDSAGRVVTATTPDTAVTSNTWNAAGQLATVTKPGGLVLAYTYDDHGQILSTTATGSNVDPVNPSASSLLLESRGYYPTGQLAVVADAMGRTTSYTYWQDNLERSRYLDRHEPVADILLQATSYDAAGHPTTIVGAGGAVTTRTYDPAGYLSTQAVDPSGLNRVTTTVRNLDGSVHHTTAATATPVAGNLSRHHLATATTASCVATEGPEKAVNDSWTGGFPDKWCSDVTGTKTLQIDLGQQASITEFKVRHAGAGGEQASWNTRAFTIQVSPDGATWTTPVTVTANTANETTHAVSTSGRYVRLNVTTPTQDGSAAARIYDLAVTGTIGTQASAGRTERVDYTYDAAGRNLTTALDNTGGSPAALTTTRVRDPRGLVVSETDSAGTTTAHTFDLTGQVLSTTGAARTIWVNGASTAGVSPVTTIGRNTFGDPTQLRDANSATVATAFDPMGRPLSTTLPSYTPPGGSAITATSSTTYTVQGKVATNTDPLGAVTAFTYDKYGRILTKTEPDPDGAGAKAAPVWTYVYDRNGELLDTTDPAGAHQSATYDELGRTVTSTQSERVGGSTFYYITTIGYDNASNPITSSTPLSHTASAVYNNAGELVQATDPTGRFTRTSRDLAGRAVATVSGQGSSYANPVTTITYDLAGRVVSTSDCTATGSGGCGTVLRTATTVFDGVSRVTQTTSAEGRPTYFGYDGAGQLTSVTQRVDPALGASAVTVNLGYDRNGNRTRMVDGNGNATIYTYTPWNLPETVVEPSTTAHPNAADRTWTSVYDAAGQAVEDRLPGSVTRTRTFDKLGRLTAETGTGATTTARSLDYDPLGRLTNATSPAGNLSYTWNDRGLLATAAGYGGTATYTYNGEGQPTGRTDGAGTATFGYDDAGRITSTVDPLTATTATNTYDSAGRLSTVTHGTGKSTREYTYDNLGRIATDTTKKPDTSTAASIAFGYDNDALLTSKTTVGLAGAGANTYTYDGLGRVTSWLNPAGTTTSYGYDAASNRTTVTTTAGTRTSTFDERNRLAGTTGASQPVDSYTWSARGTLATATKAGVTTTYTFDAFERLTQAQKTPGYTVTFTYDSLNRPAQRGTANFGYNDLSNNPILSPTAAGEAKLLREPDGDPIAAKTGTNPATLLVNNGIHRDVLATVDATTGIPDASADYDPFGSTTSSTGILPLGFQGGWTDYEAALVNAHARWYDPTTGCFTSRDTLTQPPIALAQGNRYLYGNGSPLVAYDLDGHRAVIDDGFGNIEADTPAARTRAARPIPAKDPCHDSRVPVTLARCTPSPATPPPTTSPDQKDRDACYQLARARRGCNWATPPSQQLAQYEQQINAENYERAQDAAGATCGIAAAYAAQYSNGAAVCGASNNYPGRARSQYCSAVGLCLGNQGMLPPCPGLQYFETCLDSTDTAGFPLRQGNLDNGSTQFALDTAYQQGGTCEIGAKQIICYNSSGYFNGGRIQTIGDVMMVPSSKEDFVKMLEREAADRLSLVTRPVCDKHGKCLDPAIYGRDVIAHEAAHSDQWAQFDTIGGFVAAYQYENNQGAVPRGCGLDLSACNSFEIGANLYQGSYIKRPTPGADGEFHADSSWPIYLRDRKELLP